MFDVNGKTNKHKEEDKIDSNEKLINQMEIEILSTSLLQIIKKVFRKSFP